MFVCLFTLGVSVISLDKALEITRISATVGDNVEIKCDVSGSPPMPIVWKRFEVDLSSLNQEDQVRVFSDGTLYLNKIQLLHAGNYSCHAQRNEEVIQTHMLSVQSKYVKSTQRQGNVVLAPDGQLEVWWHFYLNPASSENLTPTASTKLILSVLTLYLVA